MKMKIFLLSCVLISLVIVSGCNISVQYILKAPDDHTPQKKAADQIACQEKSTIISSSGTRLNTNNYYDCLKKRGYIIVNQYSEVPLIGDILSIEF